MDEPRGPRVPTSEDWSGREPVYASLAPLVDRVAHLLMDLRFEGVERIPAEGPALLMANHTSHLDPMVLVTLCRRRGRRVRFLALADLWDVRLVGWLLEHGHMIPVYRGRGADRAQRMVAGACAALEADQLVVVYPEGRIVAPGEDAPPKRGAGRLALATTAPVIPVAMRGVPPWERRLPKLRTPVQVAVGAPVDLTAARATGGRDGELTASAAALAEIRRLWSMTDSRA